MTNGKPMVGETKPYMENFKSYILRSIGSLEIAVCKLMLAKGAENAHEEEYFCKQAEDYIEEASKLINQAKEAIHPSST